MTQPARKYDASRRQRQALATRGRIVEAARALFIERGYAGTTLAAVAERADVALPTVYGAVGSKRALLAEMVESGGDDADTPAAPIRMFGPDDLAALAAVDDGREKVRHLADRVTHSLVTTYDLMVALRAAAGVEAEADELERRFQDQRLDDLRAFTRHLASADLLRVGLTAQSGAELAWVLTDLQSFRLLTKHRSWTTAKYRKWLTDVLAMQLLD